MLVKLQKHRWPWAYHVSRASYRDPDGKPCSRQAKVWSVRANPKHGFGRFKGLGDKMEYCEFKIEML